MIPHSHGDHGVDTLTNHHYRSNMSSPFERRTERVELKVGRYVRKMVKQAILSKQYSDPKSNLEA